MVAISILGIAMLGLAQLTLVSLQKHSAAEYNTKAVQVGRAKIEELRGTFVQQLKSGTTASDLAAGNHGPEAVTLGTATGTVQGIKAFVVRWQVTDVSGSAKSITVTVDPPSGVSLETKTITLTTVLTS